MKSDYCLKNSFIPCIPGPCLWMFKALVSQFWFESFEHFYFEISYAHISLLLDGIWYQVKRISNDNSFISSHNRKTFQICAQDLDKGRLGLSAIGNVWLLIWYWYVVGHFLMALHILCIAWLKTSWLLSQVRKKMFCFCLKKMLPFSE